MNMQKSALALVLTAALTGLAGCGASGQDSPAGNTAEESSSSMASEPKETPSGSKDGESMAAESSEKVVITVEDFEFNGPPSVSPGATITVVNKDSAPHTVTSEEDGVFDVKFDGGETVTFTAPEEPGEYPYICTIHPAMMAMLVVK